MSARPALFISQKEAPEHSEPADQNEQAPKSLRPNWISPQSSRSVDESAASADHRHQPGRMMGFAGCVLCPATGELRTPTGSTVLGRRSLALLMILLEARGELVPKNVIFDTVWPNLIVEENTLQGQVSMLRKALGSQRDLLQNQQGRGYRLCTSYVEQTSTAHKSSATVRDPCRQTHTNLSAPVGLLIGRERDISSTVEAVKQQRLVTLYGSAGVGKSRLACEVARACLTDFTGGVFLIDVATIDRGESIVTAIAKTCKILEDIRVDDEPSRASAVERKLVVLDNCDQVIDQVASLAGCLVRETENIHILVTSREPVRVEGELIRSVMPLECPLTTDTDISEVIRVSAVALLLERISAAGVQLASDQQTAMLAGEICRRLDGNPLAIELAGSRTVALGLAGVLERLGDRLRILSNGLRTAPPRHQTLRACLDWTYDLLSPLDQTVYQRLSLFSDGFDFDAAIAVCAYGDICESDVIGGVDNLIMKSFIETNRHGNVTSYRLHETVRVYSLEHLRKSGGYDEAFASHTAYLSNGLTASTLTN